MNSTAIQFFQTDDADVRLVKGLNVCHTFPCHVHNSFSFGIVRKGRRAIYIDGEQFVVSAKEGFIINPGQPHSCAVAERGGHDYWVISIAPQVLCNVVNKVPYFFQHKITDSLVIDRFLVWLGKQSKNELIDKEKLFAILRELVAQYADTRIVERPEQTGCSVVVLAREYIEANLSRVIRLDEIASVVHISPFYLNRTFREKIGVPPYTYLLQTRIKKSLELLQTGSITETAHRLGFSDQSHFTRFFKKHVGITPKRFRDSLD
jgi:AraC-like DNA-binding protein